MSRITPRSRDLNSMEGIIGQVQCTPRTVYVGQSICIDVKSPNGNSYENKNTDSISINGIEGSKQYIQFRSPGRKTILVTAKGKRGIERVKVSVNVLQPTTSAQLFPVVKVARDLQNYLPELAKHPRIR